jgi:hypothetical protein
MVYFQGRSLVLRPYMSGYSWSCQVPRAPLHGRGVTSLIVVSEPRQQVLPCVIAHTGSCVGPQPSPCLWLTLGQRVCAGGCQPRLGGGPSRRYLCVSFPACLDPYPGGSCGARTRFFPHDSGLPPVRTGSALHNVPYSDFSTARFSRLQSFTHVQAHRFAHHPGRSYRYGLRRMAAVVSPSEHLVVRYLPTPRIC